jgi:hypothetical protein
MYLTAEQSPGDDMLGMSIRMWDDRPILAYIPDNIDEVMGAKIEHVL